MESGKPTLESLLEASAAPVPLVDVRLLSPVLNPSKIVCIGLNYGEHARESGLALPEEPLVFAKFPSSITGPNDVILLPPEATKVDWEAELAVVIARPASQVSESEALDFVGGYLVANDVSARDIQARDGQWVRAKSFTSFCPLGPWITTVDEVGDASGLAIQLTVNGEMRQNGTTSDLVADVRRIVSLCSRISTLEAGDVILTGTPAGTGIGMTPQQFLSEGDHVKTSIESLGELSNRVVRATR
jgi:2-keto-4-pentenoate hydratase/2-oxohepta-3-ene-1,7-dioic acid hydratase in catechol pathway